MAVPITSCMSLPMMAISVQIHSPSLNISTLQLHLTVWHFKLEGNFSVRRAKWVKFIGCGFKPSLLLYQHKERRSSWIFSSHIIIAVATSLTVLARLLDGKLSYIKSKWVTMSGVRISTFLILGGSGQDGGFEKTI